MEQLPKQIQLVCDALRRNRMNVTFVQTKEEALQSVIDQIFDGAVVGVGGSVTLDELGLIAKLRTMPIQFLDRYAPDLTKDEIMDLHRALFTSDIFISGINAITMDGELYNMDATGNRVAAMMFGPKKVLLVAGINKIVSNLEEARTRLRTIAGPLNAIRLQRKTPCVHTNTCMDCASEERICNLESILKKQALADRIHIILVNQELGY